MTNQPEHRLNHYRLSEEIKEVLQLLGYETPTPIQQEVIPAILGENDIVAKAPIGSGKAVIFAIPICETVTWEENASRALIMESTRELVEQVKDGVFRIGRKKRLKVPVLFGGFSIEKQTQTLRQKPHIVAGAPGRVVNRIRWESLKLDKITHLIINEADLMLDMGFIDEVKEIISCLSKGCGISLFSATLRPETQNLVDEYIEDAVLIRQEEGGEMKSAITQVLYWAGRETKYDTFLMMFMTENLESCMIFYDTKEMVNVLFQKLWKARTFCGMPHRDLEQRERLEAMDAPRRGAFRYLIATDAAARGADSENTSHVVNYDFSTGRGTHVHRIGRTGWNGKEGRAISLTCEEDRRMLQMVETYMDRESPVTECPAASPEEARAFWKSQRQKAEIKPEKGKALNEGIMRLSIGDGRKSELCAGDIVRAICSIEEVEVPDIGITDIRGSLSRMEILNNKGSQALEKLQTRSIKGKVRKVRKTRTRI